MEYRKMNDDGIDDFEESCFLKNTQTNNQLEDIQELITVKQTAAICGMSDQMFSSLHKSNKTPASINFGRLRRWRKQEILNWIAAGCPDRKTWNSIKEKNHG